jgi:hypothetical protein
MGVVSWFKRRREVDLLTPEKVRIRARVSARILGCNRPEIIAVDSEAAELLKAGETNHEVLERCATISRALIEQRRALTA